MSSRRTLIPAVLRVLGIWMGTSLVLGCGGPPPRVAHPTRPLDERRALEVITEAFREERDVPVSGPRIALAPQRELQVDVGADGKRYGVAYVTTRERKALGDALPQRDPAMGDALQLVSGLGADGDARVLLLQDTDYLYDDHVGESREKSTLAAELKLRRDVRDFLVRAHGEKWP